MGDLKTPEKIQKLRLALYAKAKEEPEFRFYQLYDKIYRQDILAHAYACCRQNKGAAGVDGQNFGDVEEYGLDRWLGELAKELREKIYKPGAIRRVHIPKANGGQRPLGIPNLKDRVCQTAALIVLEPIFEADLLPEQYAYRSGKNANEAVSEVHRLVSGRHREVVDADLSGYFDSIPHAELMKSLSRRIVDRQVLHLIKMWLESAVEEEDGRGGRRRTTKNKDERKGIPQGAPISPLLSNLYMKRFILGWKNLGYEEKFQSKIVNYADDLVICCQDGHVAGAAAAMRHLMALLKLTVNEDKTRTCRMPEEDFEFLGYTFCRQYSFRWRRYYIVTKPSKKSIRRMIKSIGALTGRDKLWMSTDDLVETINRKLRGWANYFKLGSVSKAYGTIERYTSSRLRRWVCKKHKIASKGGKRYSFKAIYSKLGLMRLTKLPQTFPWAKA